MRFLTAFVALALSAASAEARITETNTPLGKYTLIEEVSALGPNETPMMHVNQNWTKLHLRFVTEDSATKIDVVDDGERLEIEIDAAKCFSKTWPVKYGDGRSGALLHLQTEKAVKALFKLCKTLTPKQKMKHLAELRQAGSDFPAALDELKARATKVFGGWRIRCIRYSTKMPESPFWGPDCVRYSARAN